MTNPNFIFYLIAGELYQKINLARILRDNGCQVDGFESATDFEIAFTDSKPHAILTPASKIAFLSESPKVLALLESKIPLIVMQPNHQGISEANITINYEDGHKECACYIVSQLAPKAILQFLCKENKMNYEQLPISKTELGQSR